MTLSKEELSGLIERVRELKGADREASRDIWQYLDTPEWKRAYLEAQAPCGCPHEQAVEYAIRYLPDVTSSVDAALALVERVQPGVELELHINKPNRDWQTALIRVQPLKMIGGEAPSLPLAIILALLLSLQSQEPTP
jgi:hypothetical protein